MKPKEHCLAWCAYCVTTFTVANLIASCATHTPVAPSVQPMYTVAPAPPAPPRPELPPESKVQEVKASWYGRGFAHRATANGETYNPESLTAASKTLPLGTIVKVSNPENGKSVKVRINDRGPFVRGRTLDLSHRAAKTLGILHKGVTRLRVQKLDASSQAGTSAANVPQTTSVGEGNRTTAAGGGSS